MRLSNFRRLNPGDFTDVPPWFEQFLEQLNPIIEDVFTAVQGNLTVPDNTNGQYLDLEVADDTEYEVQTKIKGKAIDVQIAYSAYYEYPQLAWRQESKDTIRFKVKWNTAPSGLVWVKLRIQGE